MGVFTINEKNYRLIFTKSNLTKDGIAEKETDYGDYFAWGAIEPWYNSYTIGTDGDGKPTVTSNDWKEGHSNGYANGTAPIFSPEYDSGQDFKMSDDPARKILNGGWQIPTKAIWEALVDINSKEWNNTKQVCVFENNSQTLFLPAAGYVDGTSFSGVGSLSYYWSGSACLSTGAYFLYFYDGGVGAQNYYYRYNGLSVRPVRLVEVP